MPVRIQLNAQKDLTDLLRYLSVHRYVDNTTKNRIGQNIATGALLLALEQLFDFCVASNVSLPEAFWSQLARAAVQITGDRSYFATRLHIEDDLP